MACTNIILSASASKDLWRYINVLILLLFDQLQGHYNYITFSQLQFAITITPNYCYLNYN